ncbi:hypothetical protein [Paludisphaera mucosa]|uniref:Uncharacterized protein n=1 Tax=Paludisphaera mucosa TaxID=3030827 RepID=A0ABT6FGE3_9BACT|nr:hypothetical protein [Paludisphaera mucosa]MDG3006630.1 hypothetical protein [Paludisphaera mucosa]
MDGPGREGLEVLTGDQVVPGIVGGVAGGIGAWYFVPWLFRREAARKSIARKGP